MGKRRGFTMTELLIVIIIIGILAAISVPRFAESKRQAYVAAMKGDLRNIVSAAEAHFADARTYASYATPAASSGVTLSFVGTVDSWIAQASHTAVPGLVCTVARGPATTQPTEPTCQ